MIDETDPLIGTQDPAKTITDLRNQLQQLRLAADGMAESLKEARRFLFETPFGGIHHDAILVQINQISKAEAAYRAVGDGSTSPAPQ